MKARFILSAALTVALSLSCALLVSDDEAGAVYRITYKGDGRKG